MAPPPAWPSLVAKKGSIQSQISLSIGMECSASCASQDAAAEATSFLPGAFGSRLVADRTSAAAGAAQSRAEGHWAVLGCKGAGPQQKALTLPLCHSERGVMILTWLRPEGAATVDLLQKPCCLHTSAQQHRESTRSALQRCLSSC